MSGRSSTFEFRPHLDGLRALAVLAVFVFHASPAALPGGFIGVDVFFVLSGFLITSIILRSLANSDFSLPEFFLRRLKRLLPATLALLVVVVLHTRLFSSRGELETRLDEVRATLLYVANWNLISTSDSYFAESLSASPLRHMWSLAIEEQFYLVWPIALAIMFRKFGLRRSLVIPTVGLAGASLVLLIARYDPASASRSYYGTDTRFFQPLFGAILAMVLHARRGGQPVGNRNVTRLVALSAAAGLIVLSATLDGSESAYFRWGAPVVALLTVGLIWATEREGSGLAHVLSWKPLVALGSISYGFYLWHWPAILWIQPRFDADFFERRLVNVLQLVVTMAAAIASYVAIERPVRLSKLKWRTALPVGALAAGGVALFAQVALVVPVSEIERQALADRSVFPCADGVYPCVRVEAPDPGAPTVALVGDSTAQSYDIALRTLAGQYGFRYVQAAAGGCPIGNRLLATGTDGELHKSSNLLCHDTTPGVYERLVSEFDVDLVLATSWNETSPHLTDDVIVARNTPQHLDETASFLREAVADLTGSGARLVFLEIIPRGPGVRCLDESEAAEGTCVVSIEDAFERRYNEVFRSVAAESESVAGTVALEGQTCPRGECPLVVDGVVARYDGIHFTGTHSARLAPALVAELAQIGIDIADLAVDG